MSKILLQSPNQTTDCPKEKTKIGGLLASGKMVQWIRSLYFVKSKINMKTSLHPPNSFIKYED